MSAWARALGPQIPGLGSWKCSPMPAAANCRTRGYRDRAEHMTDPYVDRRDQMFPRLTPAQIGRISAVGERRSVRAGEGLFELGEQNTRFFVVIEGAVEIVRPVDVHEERITVHGPGEFTGEINMLSARRTLVRGRALDAGSIVVVDREHLRALVQRDFELSEILMRAFILRRGALLFHRDTRPVRLRAPPSPRTPRTTEH